MRGNVVRCRHVVGVSDDATERARIIDLGLVSTDNRGRGPTGGTGRRAIVNPMSLEHDIEDADAYERPGVIAIVEEGGERIIQLSGEIDSLVVAAYEESPSAQADRFSPPNVIDASAVTFLDGRGLRFLVGRTRASRCAGGRPVLRRPARVVRRVVDVAGAAHLFTITL